MNLSLLLPSATLVGICTAAPLAAVQTLPDDPESLVELLASKSRPPLLRRPSDELERAALDFIELAEANGGPLTSEECEFLERVIGPELLGHLRPDNPLAQRAPPAGNDRVHEAIQKLEELGLRAFPALVANCQDDRYSHVACSATAYHETVGGTCMRIIASQVNPGHEYKTCCYYIGVEVQAVDIAEWWKTRSSRSLAELKREAMDWTIREERKRAARAALDGNSFLLDMANDRAASLAKERERMLGNKGIHASGGLRED